jgi:hypothetical protein
MNRICAEIDRRPVSSPSTQRRAKVNMINSMEMLKVLAMHAPRGPVPTGMKVASLAGPSVLQPAPACPLLGVGSFTLWPMSYIDNRISFGMVMYDPRWKVVHQFEKRGARYVH